MNRSSTTMKLASSRARRRRALTGSLFVLPAAAYFIIWVFAPIAYGLWLSVTKTSFGGTSTFVGLANFRRLATDPTFTSSAWTTIEYMFETVVPTMIIAFIAAYLLQRFAGRFSRALFLTLIFLPFVLPMVASAIMFELILQPSGIVNSVLHTSVGWLSDPQYALLSLSLVTTWSLVGYYVVIFMAGLSSVPQDVVEAAAIDGASRWQVLFRVELPLLKPAILFAVVTVTATALTNFATPFVMTKGGPANATLILPLLIYNTAFQYADAGYAAAMAFVLFAASVVLTALQFFFLRRRRGS